MNPLERAAFKSLAVAFRLALGRIAERAGPKPARRRARTGSGERAGKDSRGSYAGAGVGGREGWREA